MFDVIFALASIAFLVFTYVKMGWLGIAGVTLLCGAACLVTR
jgi:hypothetical protein